MKFFKDFLYETSFMVKNTKIRHTSWYAVLEIFYSRVLCFVYSIWIID